MEGNESRGGLGRKSAPQGGNAVKVASEYFTGTFETWESLFKKAAIELTITFLVTIEYALRLQGVR